MPIIPPRRLCSLVMISSDSDYRSLAPQTQTATVEGYTVAVLVDLCGDDNDLSRLELLRQVLTLYTHLHILGMLTSVEGPDEL